MSNNNEAEKAPNVDFIANIILSCQHVSNSELPALALAHINDGAEILRLKMEIDHNSSHDENRPF